MDFVIHSWHPPPLEGGDGILLVIVSYPGESFAGIVSEYGCLLGSYLSGDIHPGEGVGHRCDTLEAGGDGLQERELLLEVSNLADLVGHGSHGFDIGHLSRLTGELGIGIVGGSSLGSRSVGLSGRLGSGITLFIRLW